MKKKLALTGAATFLSVVLCQQILFAQTLVVPSWRCDQEGRYIAARGEVKNVFSEPLTLMALVTFRAVDGKLVKYDRAMVEFNPLQSGQTSPFEILTPASPEIAGCELAFRETKKGLTIQVSGRLELPGDLAPLGDARRGEILFNGKGVCFGCHGKDGDPQQISLKVEVAKLNPKPTDLRNPNVLRFKTDRERFKAIKYGIPGTAMVAMTQVTEEEIMAIIAYLDKLKLQGAK